MTRSLPASKSGIPAVSPVTLKVGPTKDKRWFITVPPGGPDTRWLCPGPALKGYQINTLPATKLKKSQAPPPTEAPLF